jgi:hypothetical protein
MPRFELYGRYFKNITTFTHDLSVGEFLCETYFMYELAQFVFETNLFHMSAQLCIHFQQIKRKKYIEVKFYIVLDNVNIWTIFTVLVYDIDQNTSESVYLSKHKKIANSYFHYSGLKSADHMINNEKLDNVIEIAKNYDIIRVMYCLSKKNFALETMF